MGRPKKLSDSEVLLRAFDVISREGFDSFTFAQVAKKTGLSPAALVKRFGTKKNLAYLARNQKWDKNLEKMNAGLAREWNGLEGIFEFVGLIAGSVDSKRLGEHARWLGTEAEDQKARKKVAAYFETTRVIFRRLIEEAIDNRQITPVADPGALAITLEALVQGSIFQFAFLGRHNIHAHLRDRLQCLLRPYRLPE